MRYGSKPIKYAKGKNAAELSTETEVAGALSKVHGSDEHGELDALIDTQ